MNVTILLSLAAGHVETRDTRARACTGLPRGHHTVAGRSQIDLSLASALCGPQLGKSRRGHIVPCGMFHRIGGAPPETFSS